MNSHLERDTKRTISFDGTYYKELVVERKGERAIVIRFNRPTVRNALNRRTYYELIRILLHASHDRNLTTVVLTGLGNVFSSGNDLNEVKNRVNYLRKFSANPVEMEKQRLIINREANIVLFYLINVMISCPKILIAMVNGASIGSAFTIAALCDIVYCTENAYFKAPFTGLGLCPEMCSSFLFPQIFGRLKAMEILTFGVKLSAEEALQHKFVTQIFKFHELDTHFWPMILQYSSLPPKSMEVTKRLIIGPMRGELLKTLAAEMEVLEKMRLGPVHQNEVEKFLKISNKNISKL